jgi:hypothetical protein
MPGEGGISIKDYAEEVWTGSLPIKLQNLPERKKRYVLAGTYLLGESNWH